MIWRFGDYVLPSAGLKVTGAGVIWPAPGDPLRPVAEAASRHSPVWVDIEMPAADLDPPGAVG